MTALTLPRLWSCQRGDGTWGGGKRPQCPSGRVGHVAWPRVGVLSLRLPGCVTLTESDNSVHLFGVSFKASTLWLEMVFP